MGRATERLSFVRAGRRRAARRARARRGGAPTGPPTAIAATASAQPPTEWPGTAVAAAQFIALVWKPSRKPETIATAVHASSFADICGESL